MGIWDYKMFIIGIDFSWISAAMELVSLDDYQEKAWNLLPKGPLDYYRSGAGDEFSLRLNRSAFDK